MNRTLILLLIAVITMIVSGCASYEEGAMSSNAVDIPNDARWPQ